MSRRNRILRNGAIAFVACVLIILSTAYSVGADPLHPRTRHIWALSLFAAFYVSFRGAKIAEQLMQKMSKANGGTGFGLFKSEHAIDKRMAARKARVEAAKAREAAKPQTDTDED